MTPPGVFFLAIFQQTANLKQIYLYDSAICQQLQFDPHQNLSEGRHQTRARIAKETNTSEGFVQRAEKFAQYVNTAEDAVPGTRAKILSGEVKPTAAELAAVSRSAPEERPDLVAEICRPRQEKRTAREKQSGQGKIEAQEAKPPLPELPKPNTGQRSRSRMSLESIRDISENMLQSNGKTDADDICAELEDALDTLIFRWNTCLQNNPELCLSGLEGIRRIGEQGIDFIKNFEQSIWKANAG